MTRPINLEFSDKYDREHAEAYFRKHQSGLSRRLSNWRDQQLARRALALADEPGLVLDLPCGAGRFWSLLAEKPNRVIIGADNSEEMLRVANEFQPPELVKRVRMMQTSAFAIDLPANAVDSVFCMRLLHHIGDSADRLALLRECHRVTRDSLILSLWVDGNYKAWKRRRLESRRQSRRAETGYQNRFVLPVTTAEAEFREAGFEIQEHLDFLPFYAMWRVYVLRKATAHAH
ncbi:class I SAM-dependent methyltransferase [Pseudomonas sp. BN415]|uniref:class I SAM-dependent methyltransferase n=1 Tax=Pseudomonas sp. BN415 TaxID=2567889 RepID=UPI0024579684|nr:class I SAM-dependent methyltransferase [Pseudomonas sp. BN415]MDH4584677.1 class I SAM-dependent methyltransferase [Pseudomonas sp. BN415]